MSGNSFEAALHIADKALYQAKENERSRSILLAGDGQERPEETV